MIAFLRSALAVFLVTTLYAPSVTFAQETQAEETSEVLILPFTPILNKPYRFEVSAWKEADGLKKNQAVLIQDLTFREREGGYSLSIETTGMFAGAERAPMPANNPLADLFGEVVFDLDPNGYPLRVANWDEVKLRIEQAIPVIARISEPDPAKLEKATEFFRRFMDRYLDLTPEEAVDQVVKYWPALLGVAGWEMVPGETVEESFATEIPLTGGTIDALSRTTIEKLSDESVRLSVLTTTDTDEIVSQVATMIKKFGDEPKEIPADIRKELSDMGKFSELLVGEYEPENGMIVSASIDRGIGPARERAEIRLLTD